MVLDIIIFLLLGVGSKFHANDATTELHSEM